MKYKVGDKVRVVDSGQLYSTYKDFIKKYAPNLINNWEYERMLPDDGIYKVKAIGKGVWGDDIVIIEQNNKVYIIRFDGLELVQSKPFTKADLKDHHIVKVKSGDYFVLKQLCQKEELDENFVPNSFEDWRIDEVWEFDKLVWKREEQILDEVEKEYLSDVIRPYNVKCIKKNENVRENLEYLNIKINGEVSIGEKISLPYFKKGTMYKKMELNKEYSIKELGL